MIKISTDDIFDWTKAFLIPTFCKTNSITVYEKLKLSGANFY